MCKLCFEPIKQNSLRSILFFNPAICPRCQKKFKPRFISEKHDDIEWLSLYDYDENIRQLLFVFKGCYDYELHSVFLAPYTGLLRLCYRDYVIVPAPSSEADDDKRGFNHVETIFTNLKLPIIRAISKQNNVKQSSRTSMERQQIIYDLRVENDIDLRGKKVLIVDDVSTTGSTIKAMVSLVKKMKPKKIKVLVIAATVFKRARRRTM